MARQLHAVSVLPASNAEGRNVEPSSLVSTGHNNELSPLAGSVLQAMPRPQQEGEYLPTSAECASSDWFALH